MPSVPDPALVTPTAPQGPNRRIRAMVMGLTAAGIVAAIAIGIHAAGKASAGGFLGPGRLIADVNLVLEILLVLGLTFGFFLVRSGNIEAHRVNQTTWVLVNAALVVTIMAASLKDVKFGSLAAFAETRVWVTWLHGAVGLLTAGAGVWIVLQMNDILPRRLHVTWWKNLMRATLIGYWIVALLGFATYYFFYVA